MKLMCIGKLTPDSLAFVMAATDAMNMTTPTSGLTSRTYHQNGIVPQKPIALAEKGGAA